MRKDSFKRLPCLLLEDDDMNMYLKLFLIESVSFPAGFVREFNFAKKKREKNHQSVTI